MSNKDDCISRRDAIGEISEHGTIWMSYTDDMSACEIAMEALSNAKDTMIRIIKGLPAVQPELHEGHWIGGDGSYICSECNGSPMDFIDTIGASFDAYVETPMNYCPNCGARMKGDTSEAD